LISQKNTDNSDSEEIVIKYQNTKFDRQTVNFAKKYTKKIIEVEVIIEKALRNLVKGTYKIQNLDKTQFNFFTEFLTKYYNLKIEKGKDKTTNHYYIYITDGSEAFLPKYRLSL